MLSLYRDDYSFEHKSSATSKENFINHIHTEWEMYYLVAGKNEFRINGSVYALEPGDLLLIKPGTFHLAHPFEEKMYERMVFLFPEKHIPQFFKEKKEENVYFFHLQQNSQTALILRCISNSVERFNQDEAFSCIINLLDVVMLYLKHDQSPLQTPKQYVTNASLNNILSYIENNPTGYLTLDSIAKNCYISKSWLTHIFKQHLNVAPKQYINYKKIIYAQRLIRTGTSPTEAFSLIGYNDYSTFFRQYKKILKRSPNDDYMNL